MQAKLGDTVKVHYTGRLDDGTVFDSSADRDPLEFTLGEGNIIPGFEEAVTGMSIGDSKTQVIPVDQAYGPHREEMVVVVERAQMPADMQPEIGQQLQIQQPSGEAIPVIVTEVSSEEITLDANHPLAGD
jgi:peptidylprolyl isomerase